MTYHFVNLVSLGWFMRRDLNSANIFCDGISLALLARIKGIRLKQISGPGIANYVQKLPNSVVLGSIQAQNVDIVLPYWSSPSDVTLSSEMIKQIEPYDNIIIAISSPKQDKLAFEIISRFPKKDVYCLGAAIGMRQEIKQLEKFNLMWLGFLIFQPKRTILKLYISIHRFLSYFLFPHSKNELNKLLSSFNNDITSIKRAKP